MGADTHKNEPSKQTDPGQGALIQGSASLGTPFSSSATRVLMLGAGELGKEVGIELQRLGVKAFQQTADLTGMVITKLDGTAKGGIVVALAREVGLPVHMVGVGESEEDLQDFTARDFAHALVGLNPE